MTEVNKNIKLANGKQQLHSAAQVKLSVVRGLLVWPSLFHRETLQWGKDTFTKCLVVEMTEQVKTVSWRGAVMSPLQPQAKLCSRRSMAEETALTRLTHWGSDFSVCRRELPDLYNQTETRLLLHTSLFLESRASGRVRLFLIRICFDSLTALWHSCFTGIILTVTVVK